MARDYVNLPALLDALEDEMDLEAMAVAKEARAVQERGLAEVKRTRGAIAKKSAVVDRMKAFADAMEERNTSNGDPTKGSLAESSPSSTASPVSARPGETAGLPEAK